MVKYFDNGGRRLSYKDCGEGDVIVLLHGYLESLLIWDRFDEVLSRHFRVISVDLPGHGQSDIVSDCHTMESMAERIKTLLDALGIGRIMLTGHSLGGYVTLAFADLYPERLAGYCLFHSHPFTDTSDAIERRNREIRVVEAGKKHIMYPGNIRKMFSPHNLKRLSDEIERSNIVASTTPDAGIISVLKGMISRPSRQHLLEKGIIPLLMILGMHDQYIDYKAITSTIAWPENATLATLFESGHLGFIEEPERSASLVIQFAIDVFGGVSEHERPE